MHWTERMKRMKVIPWCVEKLEGILDLWNREIGTDFPLRKELLLQNSFEDQNVLIDASFIALDDQEKVVGFLIAKKWQEEFPMNQKVGWIQALLVDSDFRGQGTGTNLLRKAEASLSENRIEKVQLGRDPWHYFPGVPDEYQEVKVWFEKRGYTYNWDEYDLYSDFSATPKSRIPVFENVTFSLLQADEQEKLINFLHRCFPGRWEYEAIQYFKKGGTGREFVVLKKANEIIGFCRINDSHAPFIAQNVYWSPLFNNELGGIGPLGIDPNERKNGYGLAIVEAGIAFLRERNIDHIVIDWTGLVDFYGKLGFNPWKKYAQYSKSLLNS